MVKRTREERCRFLTSVHAAIAPGLFNPPNHESDDEEDVPSPEEVRVREEGVSCESGRGLGNERATRAGMASGVRASGTSTSTVRTSKTIRCCVCELEDEMTTAGVFCQRTKSKSVPPRLLLLASFKRLASGAHWSVISECAFVSPACPSKFLAGKFVPYFSSDAYYSTHV